MHRSGTSAITRVLNLLGSDLPRRLLPAKAGDNATGYWESTDLVDLHERLLTSIGSAWDDVSPPAESWLESESGDAYRRQVVEILEREFDDSVLFAVKDPRLCRLIPFWLDALEQFGAEPAFVLPIRNPLEVAASLEKRSGFQLARSLLLWLTHVLEAERQTRGHPRSIFTYEDLVVDWGDVVEGIASDLGLSWPRFSHRAKAEISAFISDEHRHHHATVDELEARTDVVSWAKETYAALRELRRSRGREPSRTLDRIWRQVQTADDAYGPVVAEYRLAAIRARDGGRRLEQELAVGRAEVDRLGGELARHAERSGELERELAAGSRERYVLTAELSAVRDHADRLETEVASQARQLADGRQDEQQLSAELSAVRGHVEGLETEVTKQARQLADERREKQQLAAELTAVRGHAERLEAERQRLEFAFSSRRGELEESRAELESSRRQLRQSRAERKEREIGAAATERRLAAAEFDLARARSEVDRCRADTERMTELANEGCQRLLLAGEVNQRLRSSLGAANARVEALDVELEQARAQLEYLVGSRSWRLTRPLRWLLRLGRRLLR